MEGFGLLVGHLFGDYVLQNDYMAKNKRSSHAACALHCLTYTLAVWLCAFWWLPLWALPVCFALHFPVDRYKTIGPWMTAFGQKAFMEKLGPWSMIVVDNAYHLVCLWAIALTALGLWTPDVAAPLVLVAGALAVNFYYLKVEDEPEPKKEAAVVVYKLNLTGAEPAVGRAVTREPMTEAEILGESPTTHPYEVAVTFLAATADGDEPARYDTQVFKEGDFTHLAFFNCGYPVVRVTRRGVPRVDMTLWESELNRLLAAATPAPANLAPAASLPPYHSKAGTRAGFVVELSPNYADPQGRLRIAFPYVPGEPWRRAMARGEAHIQATHPAMPPHEKTRLLEELRHRLDVVTAGDTGVVDSFSDPLPLYAEQVGGIV